MMSKTEANIHGYVFRGVKKPGSLVYCASHPKVVVYSFSSMQGTELGAHSTVAEDVSSSRLKFPREISNTGEVTEIDM